MTTPNGQTPSTAANAESYATWAQTTEAEWKEDMLGQHQKPYQGIGNWFRDFQNSPLSKVPVLGDAINIIGGAVNLLTGRVGTVEKVAAQAGSVAAATANIAVTTGFIDGQYFIRQTYVANGKWTPPAIPPGAKRTGYGIQCIGGAEGGGKNANGAGDGPPGGRNGGLTYRQITPAQMGTGERDVTVGAGGVGATSPGYGQLGGLSKFSNLLASVPGGTSIQTVQGIMGSAARPGDGGRGGGVYVSKITTTKNADGAVTAVDVTYAAAFGENGESTSGAAGGRGGAPATNSGGWFPSTSPGTPPEAGADAASDDSLASGGGGAGGGAAGANADGQNGAPGGDPGGGGGGGGAAVGTKPWVGGLYSPGNGGPGRNGRVDVWTFYTMETEA